MTGGDSAMAGGAGSRAEAGPASRCAGVVPGTLTYLERAPGTGSAWWRWFFVGVWLVYLVQPVADLFGHHHSPLRAAGGVAITVAFCVIYMVVLGRWDDRPGWARRGLAALAVLAILACLAYGSDWVALWMYVSVATGFTIGRPRRAMLAVVGVTGCFALFSWITHASMSEFLSLLVPVLLIGWAMAGFRTQILLMRELSQARETVARLAASEERLRLARDMHDLTGQSLSMITLKSELAARRLGGLPAGPGRDAALTEIADIGRVSRQTLHDIRQAISGYRRPTLAVEIITARTSLDAAGIACDDDPALMLRSGSFDPEAEAALAWCLRESVTNVIRHSGARACRIRLAETAQRGGAETAQRGGAAARRGEELSVEVSDDGDVLAGPRQQADGNAAEGAPQDGRRSAGQIRPGSGLRGMAERLAAVGGRLSVEPAGARQGFRIVATVPLTPAHAPGSAGPKAVPVGAEADAEAGAAPGGARPAGPVSAGPVSAGPVSAGPVSAGPAPAGRPR